MRSAYKRFTREIFGVKNGQVSGQCRVLRNEKLYDFCILIWVQKFLNCKCRAEQCWGSGGQIRTDFRAVEPLGTLLIGNCEGGGRIKLMLGLCVVVGYGWN